MFHFIRICKSRTLVSEDLFFINLYSLFNRGLLIIQKFKCFLLFYFFRSNYCFVMIVIEVTIFIVSIRQWLNPQKVKLFIFIYYFFVKTLFVKCRLNYSSHKKELGFQNFHTFHESSRRNLTLKMSANCNILKKFDFE